MNRIQAAKESRLAMQMYAETVTEDADALIIKSLYPKWQTVIGKTVQEGYKFIYEKLLYKVVQPTLTIEAQHIPGQGTESLYAVIDEAHAGTVEDPIPYDGNMELFNGLYYSQNGVIYHCIRDSGQPVYHALADLVGLYVEVYSG